MKDYKSVLNWIIKENKSSNHIIKKINLKTTKNWIVNFTNDKIFHETGGFFAIEGIRINIFKDKLYKWDQPIINQNEIGILGFLMKELNNQPYFLMQTKIEPGNINGIQLSPTLQATESNYNALHKGKIPDYLEHFINIKNSSILSDSLQSEQGSFFLKKRNRNLILRANKNISLKKGYQWISLKVIKRLLMIDNIINMDSRSVLSQINSLQISGKLKFHNKFNCDEDLIYTSLFGIGKPKNSIEEIIDFIKFFRNKYKISITQISLNKMNGWEFTNKELKRNDNNFFKIIGVSAKIPNREKGYWEQPMLQTYNNGICTLIGKVINNIFHLIVQAKLECGNKEIVELGPTIQLLDGLNLNKKKDEIFGLNYQENSNLKKIIFSNYQSDEGGRFYKVINKYTLILAEKSFNEKLPEGFIWITLNQLYALNRIDGKINIYLRTFLSMI